jgi:hypothetical protein
MQIEQLFIVFIVALLGVLVVNTLNRIMTSIDKLKVPPPADPCKLHMYTYIENDGGEHLQCTQCNFIPSEYN